MFQFRFVTSGDAWAESFAEYLDESVRMGWAEVFAQNWAGYYSIVPSFIAKVYVWLGLPLGYIDFFYKGVVLLFATFTSAIFALKLNRSVIKSDTLRILLAVACIATLSDLTSFSFINIWYLPLIPLIFTYLSDRRLSNRADVSLGVIGALVSLTKPVLITGPIVVLRAIRSRQWIGPMIFLAGATVQAAQIIFNDRRQLVESTDLSVKDSIGGLLTGSGVGLLKLINIPPASILSVLIAVVALFLMLLVIWRTRGWWVALMLAAVFSFGVYTYVLAPDMPAYRGFWQVAELYDFNFKTQREIIINGMLVIGIFMVFETVTDKVRSRSKHWGKTAAIALPLMFVAVIHTPIDVSSAGVSADPINKFRDSLTKNQRICVPLAPTPVFLPDINWFYAHDTTCYTPLHDTNIFKPDFTNLTLRPKASRLSFDAQYFRLEKKTLSAITVPVKNLSGERGTLEVNVAGKRYRTTVSTSSEIQFAVFNTAEDPPSNQSNYSFEYRSENSGIRLGKFVNSSNALTYLYFVD